MLVYQRVPFGYPLVIKDGDPSLFLVHRNKFPWGISHGQQEEMQAQRTEDAKHIMSQEPGPLPQNLWIIDCGYI